MKHKTRKSKAKALAVQLKTAFCIATEKKLALSSFLGFAKNVNDSLCYCVSFTVGQLSEKTVHFFFLLHLIYSGSSSAMRYAAYAVNDLDFTCVTRYMLHCKYWRFMAKNYC